MTLRRSGQPPVPDGFTFGLTSRTVVFTFAGLRPQVTVVNLKMETPRLRPPAILEQLVLADVKLSSPAFGFQEQSGGLDVTVPPWTEGEMLNMLAGRLRRAPASIPDLSRAVMAAGWGDNRGVSEGLKTLIEARRIAIVSPGRYFALPWERLHVPYTEPAPGSVGYHWSAVRFWFQRGEVPSVQQEVVREVREEVAQQLGRRRADRANRASRGSGLEVLFPVRQRPSLRGVDTTLEEQRAVERARRARLGSLLLEHPWLVTPSGTIGIMVLGVRCRIVMAQMPTGALWTYAKGEGQLSGSVNAGRLFVSPGKGHGWTDATAQAVAHFEEARTAHQQGRLSAYPLGAVVLRVLMEH